MFLSQIIE